MKRMLTTSALASALLIGNAFAQEELTPAPATDEQAGVESTMPDAIRRDQAASELRVEWISGSTVTTPEGETIGSVEDLIMDQETNEITAAIIGIGGFLGFGAKQIAVDWQELTIDYDAQEISLDLTREEAEAAPAYAFRTRQRPPAETPEAGAGMQTGDGTATPVQQ